MGIAPHFLTEIGVLESCSARTQRGGGASTLPVNCSRYDTTLKSFFLYDLTESLQLIKVCEHYRDFLISSILLILLSS